MHRQRYAIAVLCAVVLCGTALAQSQDNSFRPRDPSEKNFGKPKRSGAIPVIDPPPDLADPPADGIRLESGVVMKVLKPGRGEPARMNDKVDMRYNAWFVDGQMYGTTSHLKRPRRVRMLQAMEGLQQALLHMAEGEERRVWIPHELTLASSGEVEALDVVFDLELVTIFRSPPTPEDVAAVPDDARTTNSGLAYRVLSPGDGGSTPSDSATVRLEFSAWYMDGRLYDSSVLNGRPITFSPENTVPVFAEAVPQMTVGEKWRMWVPPRLSNLEDEDKIDEMLVFDIELLSFMEPPETPRNVTRVPEDAVLDVMGLAHKVLRPGTGTRHPDYGDTIEVNYAGWTRDGKMFDSSYAHGEPAKMEIGEPWPVGWNEAVRQMVEGEKRLIWIPKELAYGDRKDRPQGMLTFQVELIAIAD